MNYHEYDYIDKISLRNWGKKLVQGWDRSGTYFSRMRFQYYGPPMPHPHAANPANAQFYSPEIWQQILEWQSPLVYERVPLRYRTKGLQFSKSQEKTLRRNQDLTCIIRPCRLTDEVHQLFENWYENRFEKPKRLHTWVTSDTVPLKCKELAVYDKDKLIACSFFDPTPAGNYSIIACYDFNESKRSLGTFTLLKEIQNTVERNKSAHYPGYTFAEPSVFDYKKNFNTAERFDWETLKWKPLDTLKPFYLNTP